MNLTRREFLHILAVAAAAGAGWPLLGRGAAKNPVDTLYDLPRFGNVSLLHITDCHAQLNPVYFREPSINIGTGAQAGRPPHLVGKAFLEHFNIPPSGPLAYAFTHLDFADAAQRYGRLGGFAHLATLIKRLRADRPGALLLDGGDTWQGSATALWTRGADMAGAAQRLGVDVMTAHWEFTYGADRFLELMKQMNAHGTAFIAQNVFDRDWDEPVFEPYVLRELNGVPVAIIGQAFPYTPIANPAYLIPQWSFGIREEHLQSVVENARHAGAQIVVLLSHNGMDVDLKLASRVSGIDVILGGHTHDAVPRALQVKNAGGTTLVTNAGSHGKFLGVLDLDVRNGNLRDYRYSLLPVFADHLDADAGMAAYIEQARRPFLEKLRQPLGVSGELLYRRGNFNGSFDQLILDALLDVQDAEIAFSPGFRWGTCVLPGATITLEDIMAQTAITYPAASIRELNGAQIKTILEDIADNLFHPDPYYQQGGDMLRTGGLRYRIDPAQRIGRRISALELNGKALEAAKTYRVAGWASVNEDAQGPPVWDVVTEYLRAHAEAPLPKRAINAPEIA